MLQASDSQCRDDSLAFVMLRGGKSFRPRQSCLWESTALTLLESATSITGGPVVAVNCNERRLVLLVTPLTQRDNSSPGTASAQAVAVAQS